MNYLDRIPFHAILQLACRVRGSGHMCLFGETWVGGFNVAVTLKFDDGVEWIFKAPKNITNETKQRLNSEVATLKFLAKIGGLPVPQMHDYSTSSQNPAQTPYIIMDKVAGVTLSRALRDSRFGKAGVHRVLERLASVRKVFRQHEFPIAGSLFLDRHNSQFANKSEGGYFTAELLSM
jgi:aminoglycoside phosphotransferase (APT) family kinase protein